MIATKKYTSEQIKDLTGFEQFLHRRGFIMTPTDNYYLNSYDCCGREWTRESGERVVIWLMDRPARIGITHPWAGYDNSFIPSEAQYEDKLNVLTAAFTALTEPGPPAKIIEK